VQNISDFALEHVHYSDEISDRDIIPDLVKVVDFIEEMEGL
jgi:hypothetical protein